MITTSSLQDAIRGYRSADSPAKRAAVYAREIAPRLAAGEPIQAANSLGTVAGELVTQRALELLVAKFPVLTSVATDYSSEAGRFGQAVKTRTIVPPAAREFVPADGYVSSAASSIDVEFTLDKHMYVQVDFGIEELAATGRDLFGEQSEAIMIGLGDDLAAALFAQITPTNFPNSTSVSQMDFRRTAMVELARRLTVRKVPANRRFALLSANYYAQLSTDETIVSLGTQQDASIVTGTTLPPMSGLVPHEVPTLPSTDKLRGFAAHPGALSVAVRPASDYSSALPDIPSAGAVSIVQEARTGLSAAVVRFVDHKFGKAYLRAAWFYGVAVGQADMGERIVEP